MFSAYEALTKMNLVSPKSQGEEIIAATLFTATLTFIVGIYFSKRRASNDTLKQLLVLALTLLFFLFFAALNSKQNNSAIFISCCWISICYRCPVRVKNIQSFFQLCFLVL